MARLVGTGKDPNGQYGAGVVFDVPRDEPHYAELIDNGWAEAVDPHDDPARGTVDIAQAVLRGDALTHPAEQDIADHIGDRAHAIVQRQDPDAAILTADEDDAIRRRAHAPNPDERPYDGNGEATSTWADGPEAGDLATHTTLEASAGEPDGTPRYPTDSTVEAQLQAEAEGKTPDAGGTASTEDDDPDDGTDVTPGARELADAEGIDISTLTGTGQDGRITKADVQEAVSARG